MRFYATRDIGRGEALAFSYLSSAACFEERRQTTAAEYCFRCECERCSAAAVAAAAAAAAAAAEGQGGTGEQVDGKTKAPLPAAVEPRLPSTIACPCGGWMYPLDGIRVCSICKQPADDDDDVDDDDDDGAAGGSSGGGAGGSAESDEQASESESEEGDSVERLSSSGGEHLASSECYCGGWRFNNRDQWLCVHCDYAIRVSEAR